MYGLVGRWIATEEARLASANRGLKYAGPPEFGLGLLADAAVQEG